MKKTKYHLGEVLVNYDRLRKPLSSMQRESFKGEYPYMVHKGLLTMLQNIVVTENTF